MKMESINVKVKKKIKEASAADKILQTTNQSNAQIFFLSFDACDRMKETHIHPYINNEKKTVICIFR